MGVSRVYWIRHAKAGRRDTWMDDDAKRPLTAKGDRQAAAIAAALAADEEGRMSRIFTSPAVRCVETVRPLAASLGLGLEEVDWLMEGADPARAMGELEASIGPASPDAGDVVVAACTHGDLMWGMLNTLAVAGVDLGEGPDAPKAAVWRLDYEAGEIRRAALMLPAAEA